MTDYFQGNPFKRPTSPYYYVFFTDASGRNRNISTRTKDLKVAQRFLAKKLEEVEQEKNGVVDRYARVRSMAIDEVIVEFREHIEAHGAVAKYCKEVARQLRLYVEFAKVQRIGDVTPASADNFLDEIRRQKSAKTRDHHAATLRAFGKWLESTSRWPENPFRNVKAKTAKRDRHKTFQRVGLSFEEVERLVDGAMARFQAEQSRGGQPTHGVHQVGAAVLDRQCLYWFAATTGFRAAECAAVRWEDLTLHGDRLSVRLAGRHTKNGRDAHIPIQPFVADLVKDMRRRRSAWQVAAGEGPVKETDFVFSVATHVARLVRRDAAFAGLIPMKSPTSRRIDFHCLRYSCAKILIQLGLKPQVVQGVLRHSDIRLTMDLYGAMGEDELFHEVAGKLPVPRSYRGVQSELQSGPVPHGASAGTSCHTKTTEEEVTGRDVRHA